MHDPVPCNESGADIAYALVDLAIPIVGILLWWSGRARPA